MNNYKIVKCDQFNVSDQEYLLVEIFVKNATKVDKGDNLFALESSKSIIDVESEMSGYFYFKKKIGENVKVGEELFIISELPIDDKFFDTIFNNENSNQKPNTTEKDTSKIITLKASKLIEKYNLDSNIFKDDVITEKIVFEYLNKDIVNNKNLINDKSNFNIIKKIAFIGAGQGLVQVLDIVYSLGNLIPTLIYDDTDSKQGSHIFNIPIAGKVNIGQIKNDFTSKKFDVIVITVSTSIDFRKKIFDELSSVGVEFGNLIHPSSNVGFNTNFGVGNVILAQTSIGPCSVIGNNNFISAHCNIEHHNSLGNNCTFGPGVMTSGNVNIGDNVKFGTGIFIEPKIIIQNDSIIASGSIITRNISENSVVYNSGIKIQVKSNK